MKIKVYSNDHGTFVFRTIKLPDTGMNVSLFLNKDIKNDGVGTIQFDWSTNENDENLYILRPKRNSEALYFGNKTYLLVNDKDKFTISEKDDLIELYKYFSGEDLNLFIKEFKFLEKEHKLKKDFK